MLHFHKEIQTSYVPRLKNRCSDGLKWELYPDSISQQLSTLICESRKPRKKDRERERKESDEENYCSRLQRVSRFPNSATQLSRRLVPTFETSPEHESGFVTRENQRHLSHHVVVIIVAVIVTKRETISIILNRRLSNRNLAFS